MTEVDITPSFGNELKDGFKPVNAWVSNGIAWLDDIQQFYRERSAIEKEYAAKLSALAKKYFEKKARKSSSLSVGDTPTVTPGSLESASMTTWTVQLTTLESRAAEHDKFASQLVTNLAEPLRILAGRYEELRKAHTDYAAKLEKERDGTYGDLRKMKGKYDSVCQEVENRRKKIDNSYDHGKTKAQVAYQQHMGEMNNIKNTYLININVTNKQKERYYHEYVPELLDSMQDLSETRITKLNSIWSLAAELETSTMARNTEYLQHLSSEIPRNNPVLDSMMFVRHNGSNWQDPPDFVFEPSPVWHDEGTIVTDDAARTFLQNVLTKSKGQLVSLGREMDTKRREVENARKARELIRQGKDKRDEVDCVKAIFSLQEKLHDVEQQKITAEVEVSTITSVVGDVSIGARNHDFKSESFKIPTNCDLCGDRIWGLNAKGFSCRDCGYTCHSKCQMKVPADCPGEQTKDDKKKLKAQRQASTSAVPTNGAASASSGDLPSLNRSDTVNSMNTLSSGYSTTAQRRVSQAMSPPLESEPSKPVASKTGTLKKNHRIVAPPPTQYIKEDDSSASGSSEQRGRMMYAYQSNGEGELSVSEGKTVIILDPDDGAGWMKVRVNGSEGLVPASYVETIASSPQLSARPASIYSTSSISLAGSTTGSASGAAKKKGPAVAPKRGAKKLKYVEALYDYEARTEAEHNISAGEQFVLIHPDQGDGWCDVEKGGVVRSVPANYVQAV